MSLPHRGRTLASRVRAARPGPDDLFVALAVHLDDLDHEVLVDERPLLDAPGHLATPLPAAPDDVPVRRLVLLPRPAFLLAPRARGMPAARALALAATQRVIDGVHRDAADGRPLALPAAPAGLAQRDQLVLGVADLAAPPL